MMIFTFNEYNGDSLKYARACAKYFLGRDVHISYYGSGKPFIVGEDAFISISHTGHDLVIAVSNQEVGIDIENKKYRHYESIAKRFFGNDKTINDINDFYREWTRYEAQYKHGGDNGVFYSIDIFEEVILTVYSSDIEYIFIPMQNILN